MSLETTNIRQFYELHHKEYDSFERSLEHNGSLFPQLSEFRKLEKIQLQTVPFHSRVLYIGAGTGRHLIPLIEKKCKITAIDFSPAMLEQTEQTISGYDIQIIRYPVHLLHKLFPSESKPGKVLLLEGDARKVNWPKESFDFAFCFCTLPLMGRQGWIDLLRRLAEAANEIVVSIYNGSILKMLATAYSSYGLVAYVNGPRITALDGFAYEVISDSEFTSRARTFGLKCKRFLHSAGRIYRCSHYPSHIK